MPNRSAVIWNTEVGTLFPGPRGWGNVLYNDTREALDWADSKESGMEMLEAKGLAED
jgi:hypothetical protein